MESWLFLAIFLPVCAAPLFAFFERYLYRYLGLFATLVALVATFAVAKVGEAVAWNQPTTVTFPWVAALSVDLSFLVDGLSLFFGLLVTGMGVLVCLYSQSYMTHRRRHSGRFYAQLLFFMTSMLGAVFSNDFILLFVFWELTSIASFLLIGFHYDQPKAVDGSRMALLVTGLTSLALLIGFLLVGLIAETYNWSDMVLHIEQLKTDSMWLNVAFIFLLIGIFGKSAQFPFHFWLPKAMVAPTPVSAYLHAATMVKLGIFLTARIYPLFVGSTLWFPLMTSFCFGTMLLGAMLSLLSNELKAILAYATVSQLGFFIGFYGMGNTAGVEYDFVHILNHALYKGSLFMLVGIVDHATGIHDIRKLGGLWRTMPLTALIFFIAAAAMAGVPGSTGFLSKELFLADVIAFGRNNPVGWWILFAAGFASLFKVAFSIRLFYHIFIRPKPLESGDYFQSPGWAIHFSPLVLSSAALYFGLSPSVFIHLTQTFFVSGLHTAEGRGIPWKGGALETFIGATILFLGLALFLLAEKTNWRWTGIPALLRFDKIYYVVIAKIPAFGRWTTRRVFSPRPDDGLLVLFGTVAGLLLSLFFFEYSLLPYLQLPGKGFATTGGILRWGITLLTVASAFGIVSLPTRIAQIVALSTAGFFITLYFVLYKAPDLAMTQLLVEVATLFFILFFLRGITLKSTRCEVSLRRKILQIAIASGMGCAAMGMAAMALQNAQEGRLGTYFLQNSLVMAKGRNVVNAILVDFRGLDTVGECLVLLLAALGATGLFLRWPLQEERVRDIQKNLEENR